MKSTLIITFLLSSAMASLLVLSIVVANMPYSPVRNSKRDVNMVGLMPQGWAFFTRSPREDQMYVYQSIDGELVRLPYSNISKESWFGFNRKVRAKGIELGNLLERTQHLSWHPCEGNLNDCPGLDTIATHDIKNTAQLRTVCGEYYLVHRPITPWAWASSDEEFYMPSKILKINVLCSE